MKLLEKELAIAKGDGSSTYAPIARATEKIPVTESARLRHKFDIAYLIATEKLSYLKYPNICELERKHGVDIGLSYTKGCSGRIFIHYIAESRRRELVDKIDKVKFFLFCWMDLPIKVIRIDNEALLLVWCDIVWHDEKFTQKHHTSNWLDLNL